MSMLVLIVQVAGRPMAIPAHDVVSVIDLGAIIPVPGAHPRISGLAAMRSQILTVIDCAVAIQESPQLDTVPASRGIVISRDGQQYALAVERVSETMTCDGDILPVPNHMAPKWRAHASGLLETGKELIPLMDVDAMIFGPAELMAG